MSLQVWLPLNGNLDNQGLSDTTITTYGTTTFNTSGKIGQSLACNGSSYWECNKITLGTSASVACWSKTSTVAKMMWVLRSTGNSQRLNLFQYNSTYYLNIGDGSTNPFVDDGGTNIPIQDSNWHHFVVTFDGTTSKLYIDGTYRGKAVYFRSPASSNSTICIAGGYGGGHSYDWNGSINDFRLYDHCLSVKEIEELAKGLMIHYKLDNCGIGNPNLLMDSNVSSLTKVRATYDRYFESSGNGSYTATFEAINDAPAPGIKYGVHYVVSTAASFHSVVWYNGGTVTVSAQPYTMSCYVKRISSGNLGFRFQYGKSPYVAQDYVIATDYEWHQYSWTFTPNTASGGAASGGSTRIYVGGPTTVGEILVCGWKLEVGSIVTPWCEYGETSGGVYDVSGYNRNGTTNALTFSSNTPRYSVNSVFNGTNSYIKTEDISWMIQGADAITINVWVKASSWPASTRIFSCTEAGGFNIEQDTTNSGYYRFIMDVYTNEARSSRAYAICASAFKVSDLPTNEWVMLTCKATKTALNTYVNGVQQQAVSITSYGIHYNTSARLFLGCEANTASPYTPYFNGQMSDFRIYTTALTDKEIVELYNESSAIDRNGNIYAREVVEQ